MGLVDPVLEEAGTTSKSTTAFAGDGDTLDNGDTIGAWTVYGIGAGQNRVGVRARIGDLIKGFDGSLHTLIASLDTYSATVWGEETTGIRLIRENSFGGASRSHAISYRGASTTNRFHEAQQACGGTPVNGQNSGATSLGTRQVGIVATQTAVDAYFSDATRGGAYTDPSSYANVVDADAIENYQGAPVFGPDDIICAEVRDYAGTDTGAVVQGVNGLLISLGGFQLSLSHVHVAAVV